MQPNSGVGYKVTRSWWALVLCGFAVLSAPVLGHHSFAVYYLEADTIDIDGEVVEFQYKNPHAWIIMQGTSFTCSVATRASIPR